MVSVAPGVRAQEADVLPDVADRYEGTGHHIGSFWLLPTLETGVFYDSNPKGESSGAKGDFGLRASPRIELQSDWQRHALKFMLAADHFSYLDQGSQSRTNFNGAVEGQIDVFHDLVVLGGIKGGMFEDAVGSLKTDDLAAEPTEHQEFDAWTSVNKSFNRFSVSLGGAYHLYDYQDVNSIVGGIIDQDFRDGDSLETGGRASFAFSPGYRVYGDFRYNWRYYDSGIGESDGWRALGGVEFEISQLLRGDIGAGYMEQYLDGGETGSGLSYHAGLTWNPSPLMTFKLDADRIIADSSVLGSPGMIEDRVGLRLDYELQRGLVLSPWATAARNDYFNSNRTDMSYELGIRIEKVMNRYLSVGANYVYTNTTIDDAAPGTDDFDRHMVGVYAKARL